MLVHDSSELVEEFEGIGIGLEHLGDGRVEQGRGDILWVEPRGTRGGKGSSRGGSDGSDGGWVDGLTEEGSRTEHGWMGW